MEVRAGRAIPLAPRIRRGLPPRLRTLTRPQRPDVPPRGLPAPRGIPAGALTTGAPPQVLLSRSEAVMQPFRISLPLGCPLAAQGTVLAGRKPQAYWKPEDVPPGMKCQGRTVMKG